MKNRKSLIVCATGAVAAVLLIFIGNHFFFSRDDKAVSVGSIVKDRSMTYRAMKAYFRGNQFETGNEDLNEYFSQTITNPDTIKFFKFLQRKITAQNLEEHLVAVSRYLHSVMDKDKADKMFALYQKFCMYEIDLAKKIQAWPQPRSAEEMISYLAKLQEYRRAVFGADAADAMWGMEVKGQVYKIRKGSIINDQFLYGAEKEQQIGELKAEMWGKGPDTVDEPPREDSERYALYQEKQALYKRDLDELSADLRDDKIAEFRKAVFTPAQIARLEKVDEETNQEKAREDEYHVQENKIKGDQTLSLDEREQAIRELQDDTFGEDADAFRRRQNIERALN